MQLITEKKDYTSQAEMLEGLAKELGGTDCFFLIGAKLDDDGVAADMCLVGSGMGLAGAVIGALTPKLVSALIEIVKEKLTEIKASASHTTH